MWDNLKIFSRSVIWNEDIIIICSNFLLKYTVSRVSGLLKQHSNILIMILRPVAVVSTLKRLGQIVVPSRILSKYLHRLLVKQGK